MNNILNLTQHLATPDQTAAGVVDLSGQDLELLLATITFEYRPDGEEILERAQRVAALVRHALVQHQKVMIGGAPFFMPALQRALQQAGCEVLYAFSRRESVDAIAPGGSIRKTSVFRHGGFVSAVRTEASIMNNPDIETLQKEVDRWKAIALYLADAHAATAEQEAITKSVSQSRKKRHFDICLRAVNMIESHEVPIHSAHRSQGDILERLREVETYYP